MVAYFNYPKIYELGHPRVRDILLADVCIEEKIDGSQISFQFDGDQVRAWSRRKELQVISDELASTEKLFNEAIKSIYTIHSSMGLNPEFIYRGEYLQKPKHNTIKYSSIPRNHIMLFDIADGPESYLSYEDKSREASRLGFDLAPRLFAGRVRSIDELLHFLDRESILGGAKIEGFVVKQYNLFSADGKPMMGKYVSEAFKEKHVKSWVKSNPSSNDIIVALIYSLKTEARWEKSIQHLKEEGKLEGSARDIGGLIREIQRDLKEEEREEIAERLLKWAMPKIARGVTAGFPEYYKQRLLKETRIESNE